MQAFMHPLLTQLLYLPGTKVEDCRNLGKVITTTVAINVMPIIVLPKKKTYG